MNLSQTNNSVFKCWNATFSRGIFNTIKKIFAVKPHTECTVTQTHDNTTKRPPVTSPSPTLTLGKHC